MANRWNRLARQHDLGGLWAHELGGVNLPDTHGCKGGVYASYLCAEETLEDERFVTQHDPQRPLSADEREFLGSELSDGPEEFYDPFFDSLFQRLPTLLDDPRRAASAVEAIIDEPQLALALYDRARYGGNRDRRLRDTLLILVHRACQNGGAAKMRKAFATTAARVAETRNGKETVLSVLDEFMRHARREHEAGMRNSHMPTTASSIVEMLGA